MIIIIITTRNRISKVTNSMMFRFIASAISIMVVVVYPLLLHWPEFLSFNVCIVEYSFG